jgi:hypothetical protein
MLEELALRLGGDGVKVPMLGEWHSSDAMSETLVLKLVLAWLGGSGLPAAVARTAPTTAEVVPQEG